MIAFAALALVASQPALAKSGDCGWVHGRYDVTNGTRIHRIWMIGSNHILSIDTPDEGAGNAAGAMRRLYGRFAPLDEDIFGDFYVCTEEARISGHMQWVHLKRVKNIRFVRR
jgi:hypothetical protein